MFHKIVWTLGIGVGFTVAFIIAFQVEFEPEKEVKVLDFKRVGGENLTVQDKRSTQPAESFYRLDKLTFFAKPVENVVPYVQMQVSLAYPLGQLQYESAILTRRQGLNSLIQAYIAEKNYYELNSSEKRENLKLELLRRINNQLKDYPVSSLYYLQFDVLPQEQE